MKQKSAMPERVRTAMDKALGRTPAGRGLTVFPNDIFLVSYFRSGSTWSRFLFGNLIHKQAVTFTNMKRLVPIIYELPDRKLRGLPRILKSHECFDPRYPRVIHCSGSAGCSGFVLLLQLESASNS